MVLRFGCPLAAERPLYSELLNTRHEHDVHPHPTSPLRAPPPGLPTTPPEGAPLSSRSFLLFAFRWSGVGCGARLPLLYFVDRGPAAVLSSPPGLVGPADGDPMSDFPGEGGGVGLYRLPSPGGRIGSPWPASRARPRGLSIVLGSLLPSTGSSLSSGRHGPSCRRSRRSSRRRDRSTPGGLARPDSSRRGRVSSALTSPDS